MTTYNTGNPIGSTDARDRLDNSENLDLAINSLSPTFVDRLGVTRDTLEGIYQKSAYYRAGTFDAGYTLTNNRQTLAYGNVEYSWAGSFPKVVAAGSTPATSGGIGAGGWIDRTDVTLRGYVQDTTIITFKNDSYGSAVDNMIAGRVNGIAGTVVHRAGNIYSTGGTAWECEVDGASTLGDFTPLNIINAKDFGAKGDGVTPDHVAIQAAIDCAEINNLKSIYLPPSAQSYVIELPLVVKSSGIHGGEGMSGSTRILKTTNTKSGLPPLPAPEGTYIAVMDVDAVVIGYNPTGYSSRLSFRDIEVKHAHELGLNKGAYGFFMPFTHDSEFINTLATWSDKGYYGYILWGCTFQRANTSVCSYGHFIENTSTSNVYLNCYVKESTKTGFYFYAMVYGSLVSCSCDLATGDAAYRFYLCRGVSVSGCGAELGTSSYLIQITGGMVVFNGFDTYNNSPSSTMIRITDGARVIMNGCNITNFSPSPQGAYNVEINNSHLITNETVMPTNGNSFIAYSGGATWIDTKGGITSYKNSQESYNIGVGVKPAFPKFGRNVNTPAGGNINTGLGRTAINPHVSITATATDQVPTVYPVVTYSDSAGNIKIRYFNDPEHTSQNFGTYNIDWIAY